MAASDRGQPSLFITKNEKPFFATSHFSLWDFFYSPFWWGKVDSKTIWNVAHSIYCGI